MNGVKKIFEDTKNSAYKIIDAKGATYYAIAMSAARIVRAIVRDERSVLTVSSMIDHHYGLTDVCIGIPCVVGRDGVEQILDIPLSDQEQLLLQKSAETLKQVLKQNRRQRA